MIGISESSSKKYKKSKRKVYFEPEKKTVNKELASLNINKEDAKTSVPITPTRSHRLREPTNLDDGKSVSITSLASLHNEEISYIDEGKELTDRSSMTPDLQKNLPEEGDIKKNTIVTEVSVHDIIKKFDEQKIQNVPKVAPRSIAKKPPEVPQKPEGKPVKIKPAVPPRSSTTKLRGRLDKSHSTPAYDLSEEPLEALPIETKPIQNLEDSLNEIGIPIVETINPKLPDLVQVKPEVPENEPIMLEVKNVLQEIVKEVIPDINPVITEVYHTVDVPPKPPPRNLVDLPKPAYPADSPKPHLITPKTTENNTGSKQFFEYPEVKTGSQVSLAYETTETYSLSSAYLEEKPPTKAFEPKLASTPISKSKIDLDMESLVYKAIPSYELQKSVVDKKVSPTNSIVKAMIKGKTGKKKNSLIASE